MTVLTIVIGASLAWCIIETRQSEVWAFFSPLTRAWELALGAMLAVVGSALACSRATYGAHSRSARAGGHSPVHVVLFLNDPVARIGGHRARGRDRRHHCRGLSSWARQLRTNCDVSPISVVGNISYSLYLVHWPVIAIATQYAIAPLPLHSEIELVAVSVALAALLYYAIENPIRRSSGWPSTAR